jgi:haloalkane dehalogenase
VEILRTPDSCFANLRDYAFEPHYVEIPDLAGGTLRIHYVDEGPRDADPVVMLHGNPTWSYLWRSIIPPVAAQGWRVIAPDLVGLGRSDKPTEMADYSVARHVEWMRSALIDTLGLQRISFVLHDWGGIIGLRILGEHPDRIARVVISNTGLPLRDPAEPMPPDADEPKGRLAAFQKMVREAPRWEPWNMIQATSPTQLPDEVIAAYRAPYPEDRYTIGSRAFTQLLPTTADNPQYPANWEAWQVVQKFQNPFLTLYSDQDVVAPHGHRQFRDAVPGAKEQPHTILKGGGHFLQEDVGDEYADVLVRFLETTRRAGS